MKAEEARKITNDSSSVQYEDVIKCIKERAYDKKYDLYYYNLESFTIKKLEEDGYTVMLSDSAELKYLISWENES
jgi:hypothetical protein